MTKIYDLFVIGGGSGGISCARRAASYGAKVGVAEGRRWGGTCVNVGCVPKKIMWWASQVREFLDESKHYGFDCGDIKFNWQHLKERRDASVKRLNGIYVKNLEGSGVDRFEAEASFTGAASADGMHTIKVGDQIIIARNVLIATGGRPAPIGIPGEEYTITSDGFFDMKEMPKKVAVIGAGYIAVELAEVLNGLGAETHLFCRGQFVLRKFDTLLSREVTTQFILAGGHLHPNSAFKAFEKNPDGTLTVILNDDSRFEGFNTVIVAVGRVPEVESLHLENANVKTGKGNHIIVNDLQETSIPGILAIGDVCGKVELTPMAIAAGRRLADRLFLSNPEFKEVKANYECVPTVVFSHPPVGTCGLTEKEARETYGNDVVIYENTSINLYYNVFDVPPAEKPKTKIKLICVLPDEKVVGLHMIGMAVDEVLQGFGVVMGLGGTKKDFDRCVAIHPTAAEEVVTCQPWGLPHPEHPTFKIASKLAPAALQD
eukprot:Gregarina_sp_Pseudo_9__5311@NODE_620_length_2476_cov_3077_684858_g568_i1_p1_GENE_NODE_620_length_2476_cov_3077_684858_g568_i1NODE_620_length_2476_cov_3077_684858_g568_i1_p1_ORF_typecomplete_len488_score51_41Pyr_redox_2/PF07992_14/1_2e54Pyr_redox_dim/PF02852_22/8_1e25Pyr_redox_3/PF13738_6/7_2e17Pyr_redox_3/PF13738_6/1_2e03Pyr_redox/PF00070_27/0_026Pyr_redox/PF00070_27/4_8e11K_oxygenase/PF13434_6/1_1e03K_oxygenase/PF13434_6/1_2e08FAD_oxidored/PF12831_7/5_4e07AlaDh_PNT_C/PF01262_21/0_86AlaDh_PNT_C/